MTKTPEQYASEFARAEAKLPQARAALQHIPGIVEIAAGIKVTNGLATGIVAYHVMVDAKKPLAELPPEHRIPAVVADLPTDVIAVFRADPETDFLWGGGPVSADLFGAGGSTLGGIALAAAGNGFVPAGTPLILTNQHVAPKRGDVVAGDRWMCNCCCCECGAVGKVVDTRRSALLDASIARLFHGVRYTHAISGIGAIRGTAVANGGDRVLKYGQTTKLTHGQILRTNFSFRRADNIVMTNQILVAPVPPSTDMSEPGDSGSLYVNAVTRQVIGLHHAGGGVLAEGCHMTTTTGAGVADSMNIEFPVMGTAGSLPLVAGPPDEQPPSILESVAALQRDLGATAAGQQWIDLVRGHADEVRQLVNHHRAAQVAWQRSQGPSFVAHFLKSARDRDYRVPREIGGVRIENAIVAMASVLQRYGSVELARAISDHYLTVLQCAKESQSAADAVAAARRATATPPGARTV